MPFEKHYVYVWSIDAKPKLRRDLIKLLHQWLPTTAGFPKRGLTQTRVGIVQSSSGALGGFRSEPKLSRDRGKCCVRTMTDNISETPVRKRRQDGNWEENWQVGHGKHRCHFGFTGR